MPAVKGEGMRGLQVFISDIRACKSKESEMKRINKELANIRSKFKGDKQLDGYQKKKYVCKLLFIFLLGNDIDFGHMEAVNLLSSNKYSEKQIGYLFISVLVGANSELMKLIIQHTKNDLNSSNPIHVSLALNCIANIGSPDMLEGVGHDVPKLLISGETADGVKQCAALCLLKLFRINPSVLPRTVEMASRICQMINDSNLGVVTSAVSLIYEFVQKFPDDYKACINLAINRLTKIVTSPDLKDYTYYFVSAPWLSVKLLKLLQLYPCPEDASQLGKLTECLENILNKAQEPPKSKKVQHPNSKNAVLFEAINLIIHLDSDQHLLIRACNQLGQYLTHRETNLRYLALESLCSMSNAEFSAEAVRKHQETVINALKTERDVSVRQRAVDLLYVMCDSTNASEIVSEMLIYLKQADFAIREELVLKIAILAEKYATDYSWYVDTILELIRVGGDFVGDEVWYRVIQVIINRDDIQGYAAKTVFEAIQAQDCHENMIKVGGYVLGEFGNLIAGDPRSSPMVQFELLHCKFPLSTLSTKALLLSSYIKLINLFPEIKETIQGVLRSDVNVKNADTELQQRSVEYLQLSSIATQDVLATVLEEMPPFPERESSLLAKLKKKKGELDMNDKEVLEPPAPAANPPAQPENVEPPKPIEIPIIAEVPAAAAAAPIEQPTSTATLLDISEPSLSIDQSLDFLGSSPAPLTVDENASKFICKNNGILFENDVIQIGVKSEFRTSAARLGLFYGNKTSCSLTNLTVKVDDRHSFDSKLVFELQSIGQTIDGGAQIQQIIKVDCMDTFTEIPSIDLSFSVNGAPQRLLLQLPLFLSKFSVPAEMGAADFFNRWKSLSNPGQECQKVFNANFPIDTESSKLKLIGCNMGLLSGIDPNPDNFVTAGIIHTRTAQIGYLIRLEPNNQVQMYRLTIRSSRVGVAEMIGNILVSQF